MQAIAQELRVEPRRRGGARRMSNPPRASGDLHTILLAMGRLEAALSDLKDKVVAQDAKSDARHAENVKRHASAEAAIDTLREDAERSQRRLENTTQETLATSNRGYRELDKRIREAAEQAEEIRGLVEAKGSDDIRAASEGGAKAALAGAGSKLTKGNGLLMFCIAAILALANGNSAIGKVLKFLHIPWAGDGT